MPAFTPQPQGITAFWLVLIAFTRRGMTRLSCPGWLVIYWDMFSRTRSWTPDTVTHPSTKRARRRLTSLIETNALTTTPSHQPVALSFSRRIECAVVILRAFRLRIWTSFLSTKLISVTAPFTGRFQSGRSARTIFISSLSSHFTRASSSSLPPLSPSITPSFLHYMQPG